MVVLIRCGRNCLVYDPPNSVKLPSGVFPAVSNVSTADYIPSVLVGEAVTSEPGRSRYEWRNQRSFTAIKSDGSVVS